MCGLFLVVFIRKFPHKKPPVLKEHRGLRFYRNLFIFVFYRFAVIGFEEQFLNFANERIARVTAGALVVKSEFGKFIQIIQKFFFLDTVFFKRTRNVEFVFLVLHHINEFLDFGIFIIAEFVFGH